MWGGGRRGEGRRERGRSGTEGEIGESSVRRRKHNFINSFPENASKFENSVSKLGDYATRSGRVRRRGEHNLCDIFARESTAYTNCR